MSFKSAYIVTKPLQYVNASNIKDANLKTLFLVDNFNRAMNFVDSVKSKSNYWDKIFIYKQKEIALINIIVNRRKYNKIFLDSDFGLKLRILLFFLIGKSVYVYEEGIASYTLFLRPDNIWHRFLSKIDFILSGAGWSGGSYVNHGIYLYNPNAFTEIVKDNLRGKKLYSFNLDFVSHITQLEEINCMDFGLKLNDYIDQKVILYITAGKVNLNVFPLLDTHKNYVKILKLHPNEKFDDLNSCYFDIQLNNTIPIEVVILNLLKNVKKLVIVHESSAALLNLFDTKGFSEFNIGEEVYKSHFENIRELFKKKG